MALSRKVTLQLGAKLRKLRPFWMSTEDDALLLLWQRMVQAVAATAVATQDLGLFVDAAGLADKRPAGVREERERLVARLAGEGDGPATSSALAKLAYDRPKQEG